MNNRTTKIIFTLLAVLFTAEVMAQVPQGFNFQAVARDGDGELIVNSQLGVRISVLQGSETGTIVYTETQTAETNGAGLFDLVIGEGESEDNFSVIDWSSDNYYVKLEIDPAGGTEYEELGTTRLLSVPYALLAQDVLNGGAGPAEPIIEYNLNSSEGDTSFSINATGTESLAGALKVRSETDGSNRGVDARVKSYIGNENSQIGMYGRAEGEGTGNHFGVYGIALGNEGVAGSRYGVYGWSESSGYYNSAITGVARGPGDGTIITDFESEEFGSFNQGLSGYASGNLNGNIGLDVGVTGTEGERINIGGEFRVFTTADGGNTAVNMLVNGSQKENFGIFGVIDGSSINRGMILNVHSGSSNIGMIVNADTAAQLNGFTEINGNLKVSGTINEASDRNLKENIQPLQNGLSTIMKLNPTTYHFRGNGEYKGLKLSSGLHYGLIAQEVEQVLPSLVKNNLHTYSEMKVDGQGPDAISETEIEKTMEYKTMNYTELIPVLIKGM
ncbi:tail fiber domain-containing protein, partial [Gracilimonas sp.]